MTESVKQFYEEYFETAHWFRCKYQDCGQLETTELDIIEHIKHNHLVFRCDVKDCQRTFKKQNLLDIHRRNHVCGFGIRGMKASGVCSVDNLRKYRREVKGVDGRLKYECKSCGHSSDDKTTILSHIHNQHIHPKPPPDD